ncbi:MAG TPA: hypothetical protein VNT53_08010 [Pseudolysinimonas sp.]|nr:hypothetical protein [Pseudolysinimonas sp.]
MRLRHLAVTVAVIGVLSACASPAPVVTASPTEPMPTATVEPGGPITTLVLSGTEITAQDSNGTEVSSQRFGDDISSMIAYLEPILGSYTPDTTDSCEFYTWGAEHQAVILAVVGSHPTSYNVRTNTSKLNGVTLTTSAGFSVGDDISEYLAKNPPSEIGAVVYDPRPDSPSSGGIAYTEGDNLVDLVITPGVGDFGEFCS